MISILGCGWLGFPLAKSFISDGISVKGSTTKEQKIEALSSFNIIPYLIKLSEIPHTTAIDDFLNNEVLIINIPPGRSIDAAEEYLRNLNLLNHYITNSAVKKLIFISSTSVYKNADKEIDELGDVENEGAGNVIFKAEEVFRNNKAVSSTIIRMSGLFGKDRHPGRFFAGKTSVSDGLNPVNLVHLDDCIAAIRKIISAGYWNETLNVCTPHHPDRKEFYTKAIQLYGGNIPDFVEKKGQYKTISPKKLITELNYEFRHPNLFEALNKC